MSKKNPICHVEWRTKDAARLQRFYASVFRWKFKDSGMPGYTLIDFGNEGTGGGLFQITPEKPPMPTGVANYYVVGELGPHEDAIKANGGSVLISNQEIPGLGWFSLCKDPDGNELALWKPLAKAKKAARRAKEAAKAAEKEAKKAAKQAKKAAKEAKKAAKKATKKEMKRANRESSARP